MVKLQNLEARVAH